MAGEIDSGERKNVELNRGLFIVNYKSADDETSPPSVKVYPAPGHEGHLEILTHPDSDPNALWQPNTSLVVRATARAVLQVEVIPGRANGSRTAAVRIEPVNQGKPASAIGLSEAGAPDLEQIRLLAHVAGIGDVKVAMNEWIAGPSTPARIEGIAIEWPLPSSHLQLRYAVRSGAAQTTGKMVEIGEFAGSRGRALPLTGLVLELSGALSDAYQIAVDAMFLSSPAMRVIGQRVVLTGPTGREPLVGLRVRLESAAAQEAPILPRPRLQPVVPLQPAPQVTAKPPSSSRVKVFRSRAK